jgi:hypothetical protein
MATIDHHCPIFALRTLFGVEASARVAKVQWAHPHLFLFVDKLFALLLPFSKEEERALHLRVFRQ